ncbi:MAG: type II toxin-antitoxin system death-on-curing family toxin [Deltaproteobacteria bacterium]|nr:type II toxin-antitoxin system death-on-curing family toxin [Deltaproteobacteria bacterium]
MRFLTVQEVLEAHAATLRRHGGASGIRDTGLLDSAVHMAQAMYGGEFLHPGLFDMAAAYLFHLVLNHPFIDGNKRCGWLAARVFLRMNGVALSVSRGEAVRLVTRLADGKVRDWREISESFAKRSR